MCVRAQVIDPFGASAQKASKTLVFEIFNLRPRTNGPTDRRTDRQTDQWTDRQMDGWTKPLIELRVRN